MTKQWIPPQTEQVVFRFYYSGFPKDGTLGTFFYKDIEVTVPFMRPISGIYEAIAKKGKNHHGVPDWQLGFNVFRKGEEDKATSSRAQSLAPYIQNFE